MAQEPKPRRLWPGIACIAAAFVIGVGYLVVARPALRRARIRRLMARHRAEPSQETAQALADLLDRQRAPQALGNEILELLVTPDVAVRAAYPVGEQPHVVVEHPLAFGLGETSLVSRCDLLVAGKGRHLRSGSWNPADLAPWIVRMPVPPVPGRYECALGYDVRLTTEPVMQYGPLATPPATAQQVRMAYACAFRVPFVVRVVEASRAERIGRRTDPKLDRAVRSAVQVREEPCGQGTTLPGGEHYHTLGRARLEVGTLPENVGFRFTYRDQGGMTMRVPSWSFRRRASMPVTAAMLPLAALRLPPGTYEGTAILQPDEAAAYPDAAIKTIWGGTIELPIELTVRVTEAREGQSGGSDDAK